MTKVYIFLADGFETVEALCVVDMLRRASISVETVSMMPSRQVESAQKVSVMTDCLYSERDFQDADLLILPGGMPGTTHLQEDSRLSELLIAHNKKEKLVAAICAAPSVLGKLNILSGKRACCYPGYEEMLLGAKVTMQDVTIDKNVITSRGMGTSIPFAAAIIEALSSKEQSKEILNKIQYK